MQEALRNNGQPGDMLTSIWGLAGQVLLDVPDCPVQLAQAVYTLMGKDPPEHLLHSPVQEVSERQARTTEALEAISLTAQTSNSISWLRHLSNRLVQMWQTLHLPAQLLLQVVRVHSLSKSLPFS